MRTALLSLSLLLMGVQAAPAPAQSVPEVVGTRPALSVPTLDGAGFDLADHRGRWVVVNYWATWCAPCIKEIPELSALADRDDVEVLGLDFEEIERADLDAFLERHPPRYPISPVDVYDPPKAFPVPRGLPMTWLVDPEGVVAAGFVGPVTKAEIEQAISEAAAADTPDD
jgi:thiol-disulfide isomerase/thioredoxin